MLGVWNWRKTMMTLQQTVMMISVVLFAALALACRSATALRMTQQYPPKISQTNRRGFLTTFSSASVSVALPLIDPRPARAAQPNGLPLTTSVSTGLKWADARVGSGTPPSSGQIASIDYSMASTAGRFPQIYTTKDKGAPYRWKLGDGSTIKGIELAVLGDAEGGEGGGDIPPMLPGGIRRVIVPSSLGYESLRSANNAKCIAGAEGSIGPIPPKDKDFEAYQRWYSFYCNPRIPYQPDLVLDIKLYGRR